MAEAFKALFTFSKRRRSFSTIMVGGRKQGSEILVAAFRGKSKGEREMDYWLKKLVLCFKKIHFTHKITVFCVCDQLFNIWGQTVKMWLWRLTWKRERVYVLMLWDWPCPGMSCTLTAHTRWNLENLKTRLILSQNKLIGIYIYI